MNASTQTDAPFRLGFTGTRHGMYDEQRRSVIRWLGGHWPAECHHGLCVGADSDFHDIVTSHADVWPGSAKPKVVGHPPLNRSKVVLADEMFCEEVRPPADYLDRNRAIVADCDHLLACPNGSEELRSGTWSTVRYARRAGKPATIIYPDGRIEEEPGRAEAKLAATEGRS
jgi:hypothetical protein